MGTLDLFKFTIRLDNLSKIEARDKQTSTQLSQLSKIHLETLEFLLYEGVKGG